jgi:hypothetical protein
MACVDQAEEGHDDTLRLIFDKKHRPGSEIGGALYDS